MEAFEAVGDESLAVKAAFPCLFWRGYRDTQRMSRRCWAIS